MMENRRCIIWKKVIEGKRMEERERQRELSEGEEPYRAYTRRFTPV